MRLELENINPIKFSMELYKRGIQATIYTDTEGNLSHIADRATVVFDTKFEDEVLDLFQEHDPTVQLDYSDVSRESREELLEQRINELELYILAQEGLI